MRWRTHPICGVRGTSILVSMTGNVCFYAEIVAVIMIFHINKSRESRRDEVEIGKKIVQVHNSPARAAKIPQHASNASTYLKNVWGEGCVPG